MENLKKKNDEIKRIINSCYEEIIVESDKDKALKRIVQCLEAEGILDEAFRIRKEVEKYLSNNHLFTKEELEKILPEFAAISFASKSIQEEIDNERLSYNLMSLYRYGKKDNDNSLSEIMPNEYLESVFADKILKIKNTILNSGEVEKQVKSFFSYDDIKDIAKSLIGNDLNDDRFNNFLNYLVSKEGYTKFIKIISTICSKNDEDDLEYEMPERIRPILESATEVIVPSLTGEFLEEALPKSKTWENIYNNECGDEALYLVISKLPNKNKVRLR